MDRYFYLVAQLPILFFDTPPRISFEDFCHEAEKWLTPRDWGILCNADMYDITPFEGEPGALRQYKVFEAGVRRDVMHFREARRAGQEYRPVTFTVSVVREGNPLEVEKKLLWVRWDFVDRTEREHHFDLEFLVLYSLKLQILRRLASFDGEKGLEEFRAVCEVEA